MHCKKDIGENPTKKFTFSCVEDFRGTRIKFRDLAFLSQLFPHFHYTKIVKVYTSSDCDIDRAREALVRNMRCCICEIFFEADEKKKNDQRTKVQLDCLDHFAHEECLNRLILHSKVLLCPLCRKRCDVCKSLDTMDVEYINNYPTDIRQIKYIKF